MKYEEMLHNLGFTQDLFASTNADEEDRLQEYFIEPPFFKAVYGDPNVARSSLVFAPRGGGKTALKRMIEIYGPDDGLLCVTYNRFDTVNRKLNQINLAYHLKNIIILVLIGVLERTRESGGVNLTNDERHLLYLFVQKYLSDIDKSELRRVIEGVRNLSDTAVEWWNKLCAPASAVLAPILLYLGLTPIEIERLDEGGEQLGSMFEQLRALGRMASKQGFKAIYVLIDRVDENPLTGNDAHKSFEFVKDLLTNLEYLELEAIATKFFLWNLLIKPFREHGRPDRIKGYELEWSIDQLNEMLSRRTKAYSAGVVSSFESICEKSAEFDLAECLAFFSQGSPRNLIRICKEIVDQQSEIDHTARTISTSAIERGIENFARNYCTENIDPAVLRDLQKVDRADFTVLHVYREVFKVTQQAGMQKIQNWQNRGLVNQVGVLKEAESSTRPSNHYALSSVVIAKYVFSDIPLYDFYARKVQRCSNCGAFNVRDWDIRPEQNCASCQAMIKASGC